MRKRRAHWRLLPVALVLSACTDGQADGGGMNAGSGGSDSSRIPPIHVDLLEEQLVDGENALQRDYRDALKICQEAGFAIMPLSESDATRIGTRRIRIWHGQGFEAVRDQSWEWTLDDSSLPKSCKFELITNGVHDYTDGVTWQSMDLQTGDASRGSAQGSLERFAVAGEDMASDVPGFRMTGTRKIAGHECIEWTSTSKSGITQCLWSEGLAYGFATDSPGNACSPEPLPRHSIVLSQQPSDGTGCRITTERMSVGVPFEDEDFRPSAQ